LSSGVEPLSGPEPYEPPKIEARDPIVGVLSNVGSVQLSAVFRPTTGYEPPKIEDRTKIDLPLIGNSSTLCVRFP
jgi:hypothetical protein